MTDLSSLGAHTAGVWTRQAALLLLRRGQVDALVRSGTWQLLYPGVYCDGGYVPSPVQRAQAAALAGGATDIRVAGETRRSLGAIPCGSTAARVWGFPLIDDDDPATGSAEHLVEDVHAWVKPGQPSISGSQSRTVRRRHLTLLEGELVRHPSGLWLTSAVRTALDCALLLPSPAAVCVLDHGLHQRLFTADDLQAALAARRGWPGVHRQATAVSLADGRSEAPTETLARLLLLPALPGLVPQVRVRNSSGQVIARVDLGDETLRLGVETDGKRGHAGTQMVAKDRRRDRRTEAVGWWTERVTWFELRCRQQEVVRRILDRAQLRAAS